MIVQQSFRPSCGLSAAQSPFDVQRPKSAIDLGLHHAHARQNIIINPTLPRHRPTSTQRPVSQRYSYLTEAQRQEYISLRNNYPPCPVIHQVRHGRSVDTITRRMVAPQVHQIRRPLHQIKVASITYVPRINNIVNLQPVIHGPISIQKRSVRINHLPDLRSVRQQVIVNPGARYNTISSIPKGMPQPPGLRLQDLERHAPVPSRPTAVHAIGLDAILTESIIEGPGGVRLR